MKSSSTRTRKLPPNVVSTVVNPELATSYNPLIARWSGVLPVPAIGTTFPAPRPYCYRESGSGKGPRVPEGTKLKVIAYDVEYGYLYLVCKPERGSARPYVAGCDLPRGVVAPEPQGFGEVLNQRWAAGQDGNVIALHPSAVGTPAHPQGYIVARACYRVVDGKPDVETLRLARAIAALPDLLTTLRTIASRANADQLNADTVAAMAQAALDKAEVGRER